MINRYENLVAIVHYWNPDGNGRHQSLRPNPLPRTQAIKAQIQSLRRLAGFTSLLHLEDRSVYRINSSFNIDIDIKIVTDGCHHVFEFLDPPYLEAFEHIPSKPSSPMHLGFEAHRVLQEHLDQDYDYYYLEDDLIINDASFFRSSPLLLVFGINFLCFPKDMNFRTLFIRYFYRWSY